MHNDQSDLPEVFYLGKIRNEWPIHGFVTQDQVMAWLSDDEFNSRGWSKTKRAWEFKNGVLVREVGVVVVPPRLATLADKDTP